MTAAFLTELVTRVGDVGEWILDEPLKYVTGDDEIVIVPVGFVTDLASIPIGFRNLFPINGRHRQAAVIHDYLYANKIGTRQKADSIFLEAMVVCEVPLWRRRIMYRAVRLFGWVFWR